MGWPPGQDQSSEITARDGRNEGDSPIRKKSPFYPASPVSRFQSHVWSFGCLARLGRRAKKKE